MNLLHIVQHRTVLAPWEEGDNIPWDEPAFSRRMLREHLCQEHDLASRRFTTIDRHVGWIHNEILGGKGTRILDLACGPGLYMTRLARLGHECVGIDISPSAVAYAQAEAQRDGLRCTYIHDDIRAADFGGDFGLAMLLYGEFNAFSPLDARALLRKMSQALACDGVLLLEPHSFTAIQRMGQRGRSWYSAPSGVFSDVPHLCLMEDTWDPERHTATTRYFVIDAATGEVTVHAQTMQAYSAREYETMLNERGLEDVRFYPSLTGIREAAQVDFFVIVAREGTEAS